MKNPNGKFETEMEAANVHFHEKPGKLEISCNVVRAKHSYSHSTLIEHLVYARFCFRCFLCSDEQDSMVPTQGETGIK